MSVYSDEDGASAVRLARAVIDGICLNKPVPEIPLSPAFARNSGVFVTIDTYPARELRGCIGYPEPYFPLKEAVQKAAEGATNDPRFEPLSAKEVDKVVVEVSILTPPELITVNSPKEYKKMIKIGRDGLIASRGPHKGLLLPQVAAEYGWDAEEFLAQTCMKAGLMPDQWVEKFTRFNKFQAEIFCEEAPRGKISRKKLGD